MSDIDITQTDPPSIEIESSEVTVELTPQAEFTIDVTVNESTQTISVSRYEIDVTDDTPPEIVLEPTVPSIEFILGEQGDPGADGSQWFADSGVPGAGLGDDHDFYLDVVTGDVYEKQAGSWVLVGNIKGPDGAQGPAGPAGADGSEWHSGSGPPPGGLGDAGDFYLDTANGDVYEKNGTWVLIANLTGPTGPQGPPGDPAPTVQADYLVLSFEALLDNERRFVAGTALSSTDGGANGDFTVDHEQVASGDLHTEYLKADGSRNVAGLLQFEAGLRVDALQTIRFRDSDNSHQTTLKAGAQATNVDYTLPTAAPTVSGQLLSATTAGVMSWVDAPDTGAPDDAQYLVLALDATLSDERRFVPGTALAAVDGGAGADYTLNHSQVASGDLHTEYLKADGSRNVTGLLQFEAGLRVDATQTVRFRDSDDSHQTTIKAGAQIANVDYTLPTAAPTSSGQLLSSTTLGVMSWVDAPDTGAPEDAQYLVLALDATLTVERRFVPGTALSAVDGGAGGDYTLNHAQVASGDLHTEYLLATGTRNVTGLLRFEAGLRIDATQSIALRDTDDSHQTTITAGAQVANIAYTLPTAAPTVSGQLLSATTAGVMSWVDESTDAPVAAQYMVLALDATLTNERRFVPGVGLVGADGGAGGDYDLKVGGFTDGAMLFAGASGDVAEDKPSLYWDRINKRLGVGDDDTLIQLAGSSESARLSVQPETDTIVLLLWRNEATASTPADLMMARSRGTNGSETIVADGDHLGCIHFAGHDGTDYELAARIRAEVDGTPGAGDMPGRLLFLTSADGGATPAERMRIAASGLITIGLGGSFSLATGANDLGIVGDLEVDGNTRFDDTFSYGTDPSTVSMFKGVVNSATIVTGMTLDVTYTGSASTTSGLNVLDFSYVDQSTSPSTVRAIRAETEFDRSTMPTSNEQIAIEVIGYGAQSSRVISSGTYTWRGLKITGRDSVATHTGGTVEMIDIETADPPTGYGDPGQTFTHYGFKCGGTVWLKDSVRMGMGVSSPAVLIDMAETGVYQGSVSDTNLAGIQSKATLNKTGLGAIIQRLNFIEIDNPTTGLGVTLNNACVFRFDAALGTHKFTTNLDKTGNSKVGTIKVNANGTIVHLQLYAN